MARLSAPANRRKLSPEDERRVELLFFTLVGVRRQRKLARLHSYERPNADANVHGGLLFDERFGSDFTVRVVL
jgi:hypothetical protein